MSGLRASSRSWALWRAALLAIAVVAAWLGPSSTLQAGRPASVAGADARAPAAQTRNPQVEAANGMVASAHALASQAGIEMLKAGGNAVDAAVAAAFAVGVAEPNATGLGGEGMMVVYLADRKTAVAIDYRSSAPAKASYTGSVPATGHRAVAVPGTVAGLALALEKYGTMKLPQVLAPAIRIAADGFRVSPVLTEAITENFEAILANPPLAKLLCPTGLPLEAGATLKNPDLAATLRALAAGGRDAFYRGAIAETIVAEMQAQGGFITKDDLAAYAAIERTPIEGSYRGVRLISAPPPVGGLAVVEILHILEQFDVAKLKPFSAAHVHLFAEAMRRGFADWSAFVGDPSFVTVPVAGLLSKPYAKARASEISLDRITPRVAAGDPAKLSPSTTSLSTVDKAGNMVALTQTLSDFFGAKVLVGGTGIILNNEMRNFSARGPNALAPGKRMRTTVAPTIVVRGGRAFATLGTPGAARIISTMTLLLSNLIDYGMGIQEAIEAPRFFARDSAGQEGNALDVEARLPEATITALTKMGYTVRPMLDFDLFFGGAQGIVIDSKSGKRVGGADPRRDGAVIGY
jgi:gamma-glutamyltranspeptidase/glutathione hydrolase